MPGFRMKTSEPPLEGGMTHDIGNQETRPGSRGSRDQETDWFWNQSFPNHRKKVHVSAPGKPNCTLGLDSNVLHQLKTEHGPRVLLPSSTQFIRIRTRSVSQHVQKGTETQGEPNTPGLDAPLTSISASLAGSPTWSAEPPRAGMLLEPCAPLSCSSSGWPEQGPSHRPPPCSPWGSSASGWSPCSPHSAPSPATARRSGGSRRSRSYCCGTGSGWPRRPCSPPSLPSPSSLCRSPHPWNRECTVIAPRPGKQTHSEGQCR